MQHERRGFLKKLAGAGAIAATAGVATAVAGEKKKPPQHSGGVVVGHSPKKEILYTKTAAWEAYYNAAV